METDKKIDEGTGSRKVPSVTTLQDKSVVVCWPSDGIEIQDSSAIGMYCRLIDDSLNLSSQLKVTDSCYSPAMDRWPHINVASLNDPIYPNAFVVGRSDCSGHVYFHKYYFDGNNFNTIGSEFQPSQLNPLAYPFINALSDNYIVTYGYVSKPESTVPNIQKLDSSNNVLVSEKSIPTDTNSLTTMTINSVLYNGNIAAVYANGTDIVLNLFDENIDDVKRNVIVNTFRGEHYTWEEVSTFQTKLHGGVTITPINSNNFVVIWSREGGESIGSDLYGQKFDNDGNKIGSEFLISNYRYGDQILPNAKLLQDGSIIVTWSSEKEGVEGFFVRGARFDSNFKQIGPEFDVSSYSEGDMQLHPQVATLGDDQYVVTWYAKHGENNYNIYLNSFSSFYYENQVNCNFEHTPGKISGFNVIVGSDECDSLAAGISSTVLRAGKGNDTLISGPGADLLDGGEGSADTVDYSKSPSGIRIDLEQCIGKGGYAEGDVLRSIERVIGSSYNDIFVVGNDTAHIICGKGNDTVIMSPYNTKVAIDCGEGYNTLSFDRSILGVDFNATSGDYHYGN